MWTSAYPSPPSKNELQVAEDSFDIRRHQRIAPAGTLKARAIPSVDPSMGHGTTQIANDMNKLKSEPQPLTEPRARTGHPDASTNSTPKGNNQLESVRSPSQKSQSTEKELGTPVTFRGAENHSQRGPKLEAIRDFKNNARGGASFDHSRAVLSNPSSLTNKVTEQIDNVPSTNSAVEPARQSDKSASSQPSRKDLRASADQESLPGSVNDSKKATTPIHKVNHEPNKTASTNDKNRSFLSKFGKIIWKKLVSFGRWIKDLISQKKGVRANSPKESWWARGKKRPVPQGESEALPHNAATNLKSGDDDSGNKKNVSDRKAISLQSVKDSQKFAAIRSLWSRIKDQLVATKNSSWSFINRTLRRKPLNSSEKVPETRFEVHSKPIDPSTLVAQEKLPNLRKTATSSIGGTERNPKDGSPKNLVEQAHHQQPPGGLRQDTHSQITESAVSQTHKNFSWWDLLKNTFKNSHSGYNILGRIIKIWGYASSHLGNGSKKLALTTSKAEESSIQPSRNTIETSEKNKQAIPGKREEDLRESSGSKSLKEDTFAKKSNKEVPEKELVPNKEEKKQELLKKIVLNEQPGNTITSHQDPEQKKDEIVLQKDTDFSNKNSQSNSSTFTSIRYMVSVLNHKLNHYSDFFIGG